MNTAKATFRVAFFGNHWQVSCGDVTVTCKNKTQLTAVLSGDLTAGELLPALVERTKVREETVEEFLARGGKISRHTPTRVEPPAPQSAPAKKAAAFLTLEALGLVMTTKESGK